MEQKNPLKIGKMEELFKIFCIIATELSSWQRCCVQLYWPEFRTLYLPFRRHVTSFFMFLFKQFINKLIKCTIILKAKHRLPQQMKN